MRAGLAGLTVAITVDRGTHHPQGQYVWGSGCLVGPDTVLTAAHVLTDAVTVTVRTADLTVHPATVNPPFVGDPGGWDPHRPGPPDLALLTLATAVEVSRLPVARVDRDHPAGLVDRVRSLGYPGFGETNTEAKETVRVQTPAAGQVLLSDREDGLLDFQVTIAPPSPTGAAGTQWQGMSGAPVTAGGFLIGVITEHAPRKGPSNIAIIPLTALQPHPTHPSWGTGVGNPDAWWPRLGITDPTDAAAVAVIPAPREAPYLATLREFGRALHQRMPELVGREAELKEIAAFATGAEPYRWLVGGAFTGKSALLFEATTAGVLPDTVDVVSYFLTRRSSDATADRFLTAVVPQLEVLLDWPHETPDQNRFNQTWQEATATAHRTERHLLLIVDALDEDIHPANSPWVTDLLPAIVGPNAHVLVSSRPYPQIRDHVPSSHPLKACPELDIEPFQGSAELAELAESEIDAMVDGDDLDVDALGLLTAAAGPLSLTDLTALHTYPDPPTAATRKNLRHLLIERAARSLEPVGSLDAPRYRFAHELLAEHARTNLDLADLEYRKRIHMWAGTWAEAEWPDPQPDGSGTPLYLLDTYPATLLGDPTRPGPLPQQPVGWVDVAIRTLRIDSALGALRAAGPHADPFAAALYTTVAAQVPNLRPPHPIDQPGYVLRHLCLQALRFGMSDLARDLQARLTLNGGLIPKWTSSQMAPSALELGSHDDSVWAVAVLPDGRVVTGGGDNRVRIWDPAHPGIPLDLGGHDSWVSAVAVLPDGRVVTGGGDNRVRIWDPAHPGTRLELGTHDDGVNVVAVLPDGRVVIGSGDYRTWIWDADQPGAPIEFGTYDNAVVAVAVLPDGRVVTGDADHRVLIWDPDHPGAPLELGTHDSPVDAVAVLADGRIVTGGGDNRVRIWESDHPGALLELGTNDSSVIAVAVLPDGRIVTGGADNRVRIWDPDLPGAPLELGSHDSPVTAVGVLPDGRVVTGGADARVRIWDPGRAGILLDFDSHDRWVSAVGVLPDGRIVTAGWDTRVRIWDPQHPGTPVDLGSHDGAVGALAVLPDGRVVTGGDDNLVRIWDPDHPDTTVDLGSHDRWVSAVAVMPNGRIVTGGWDGRARIWDPDHPGTPLDLGSHDTAIYAVAVLPDGRIVTGGSDNPVRVWDPDHPGTPLDLGIYDGPMMAVDVLRDGRVVTGGANGQVRIWNPDHPGTPLDLGTHDGRVSVVAVLPDGSVATSGHDHQVRISDPDHPGTPVLVINDAVNGIATSHYPVDPQDIVLAGYALTLLRIAPAAPPPRTSGAA